MDKIEYTLTLEDYKDFTKFQLKIPRLRKYILKRALKPAIIVSVLDLIVNVAIMIHDKSFGFYLIVMLALLLPLAIFLFIVVFKIIIVACCLFCGISAKNMYKMHKGISMEYKTSVTDEKIIVSRKDSATEYNYNGIIDIYDTKKTFLLFIGNYLAILVPHRAFENEEKAQEFFDFVSKKIQESKEQKA